MAFFRYPQAVAQKSSQGPTFRDYRKVGWSIHRSYIKIKKDYSFYKWCH